MFGEPPCTFELGQRILVRVKEPLTKFAPRLQAAVFLGFAPGVTNGYFVMRPDGKVELTSNITEDTMLDDPEAVLPDNLQLGQSSKEVLKDGEDEIVYKKDGGIHGAPRGAVHSMYYAKVWWGENTPMHIMQ